MVLGFEWYYVLGIASYAIFLIQAFFSVLGADIDVDFDMDGDVDFDGADLFSFKGLLHFCIGMSTWLMLADSCKIHMDPYLLYIIGVIVGAAFSVMLYYTYKACLKFNHVPDEPDIVGMQGTVYLMYDTDDPQYISRYTVNVETESGTIEAEAYSHELHKKGDAVVILSKVSDKYYMI